ncbi:MAG: adenylate kinase family protein [Acidimicrobiales bacterium]
MDDVEHGVQTSGKGTQAKLLAADLDLVHIGVGDIFRWNVQEHTKLGAQVRRILAEGGLVDDELVESVVRDRLALHDWNYGFIIDGFPRNARQAEFFLESYDIDGVVVLELPDKEVHRRVLARRLCSRCGLDYNLIASRPAEPETCDVCGGQLVARPDDTPEVLAARLGTYRMSASTPSTAHRNRRFATEVALTDTAPQRATVTRLGRGRWGEVPRTLPPASASAVTLNVEAFPKFAVTMTGRA